MLFNKKNLIPLHSEFLRIWAQYIVKQIEKTTFFKVLCQLYNN